MEITSVILKPKITEKTQNMRDMATPKMTFYVSPKANKNQISNAFRAIFGVKPNSVNVFNGKPSPARMTSRSRKNYKKSYKIAYITVSADDFHGFQKKFEDLQALEEAASGKDSSKEGE